MRIEAVLKCFGYFGFGGGWDLVTNHDNPDLDKPLGTPIYCITGCKINKSCWEAHRARAAKSFPDAHAEFVGLLEEHDDGPEAVRIYHERYHTAPPDIVMSTGNIEDGGMVAQGLDPHDRGPYTLTFPFPEEADAQA